MNRETETSETVAAVDARRLMRGARTATMATIDANSGDPHASLVIVATAPDGAPVILISALASHTRNILATARASLLFDGTKGIGDPLEGSRVSVTGAIASTTDPVAQRRFLARHPTAERYAGFADFAYYRLDVDVGHFVGGFGRIHEIAGGDILLPPETSRAIGEAEPAIIAHMNADHADAVELIAANLLGAEPGRWRFVGCDAEGCDLGLGDVVLRLDFPRPVGRAPEFREVLVDLTARARSHRGSTAGQGANTQVQ